MERRAAARWVSEFFDAWRTGSPELAASMFTEDATYQAHPFAEPLRGRQAIDDYWRAAVERQDEIDVSVGRPVVDGDRVAVEWWATTTEGGEAEVSTGSLFLTFSDGACASLREVWMGRRGRIEPYPGWGS